MSYVRPSKGFIYGPSAIPVTALRARWRPGCDLTELSAFPHEKEFLYPSLTFMQPTGVTHTLKHGGTTFTVVEVEPAFPS